MSNRYKGFQGWLGIWLGIFIFVMVFSSMPALLPVLGNGTYALLCFAVSHFGMSLSLFIESFDKKEKVD